MTVVALFAIFATAALTVPDVPTSPQLTVLSDSSIEMLTSSVYLGPNEVQTVQTHAGDVDEVQTVTTGTTEIREVQSITVLPGSGLISMDSTWAFALSLDTVDSLQYSGQIAGDAAGSDTDAAYVNAGNSARLTVEAIIGFMSNIDSGVEVSDRIDNGSGSYSWLVTFPASMGNVPQMTSYMSGESGSLGLPPPCEGGSLGNRSSHARSHGSHLSSANILTHQRAPPPTTRFAPRRRPHHDRHGPGR